MNMKKSQKETDTSSSEDEASKDLLRKAIDPQFFNDNLCVTKEANVSSQSVQRINKLNTVSSRTHMKQDQFTNFGVSTSFQKFVAKKLDEALDKIIKLEEGQTSDYFMKQQKKKKNSGIKLLSDSENFLITTEIPIDEGKCKKRKMCYEITEDNDAKSKFRSVAVDSEHVLSKVDTKGWTSKRPEPEFKYKRLKNGTLVEQQ